MKKKEMNNTKKIIVKLEETVLNKIEELENSSADDAKSKALVEELKGLSTVLAVQKNRPTLNKIKLLEIALPILAAAAIYLVSLDFETDHVVSRSVTKSCVNFFKFKK